MTCLGIAAEFEPVAQATALGCGGEAGRAEQVGCVPLMLGLMRTGNNEEPLRWGRITVNFDSSAYPYRCGGRQLATLDRQISLSRS